MHAHVLRLRVKRAVTSADRTRVMRVGLPALSAARGFVDAVLLEGEANEVELVSFWMTAGASKTKRVAETMREVAALLNAKVVFAGPMKVGVPMLPRALPTSPFPHNQGDYVTPDAQVGPHHDPLKPRQLDCPGGKFVIYVFEAKWVDDCGGFGPGNANNALCNKAAAAATAAAKQITCPSTCARRVAEIWRGWDCQAENKGFIAFGAAEVAVTCDIDP